ncbi:hypothetical protein [Lutibacter sp.]|uniref:hypothetical protein n=1 Tax=Lutibacter sp. TaxID=1925666 RepID=UPI003565B152
MKKDSKHKSPQNKSTLGFKIPSGYFETFQQEIFEKIAEENKQKEQQQKLGFKVPENYFETSKKEILELTETKKGKVINFITLNKWLVGSIAAAIALLITLSVFNNFSLETNNQMAVINNIEAINLENDAILNSILENDANVNEYMETYVLNELVVKDALKNFISWDARELEVLFIEDSKLNNYIDALVIEDLIIDDILND